MKFKNAVKSFFYAIIAFVMQHKITSAVITAVVAGVVAAAIIVTSILSAPQKSAFSSATVSSIPVSVSEPQDSVSSEEEVVDTSEPEPIQSETSTVSSVPETTVTSEPVASTVNTQFNYNSNMSADSNVFLDALEYTGYNLAQNRKSGLMWASGSNYVLCSRKRGLGWLSNITYGGGCSGYETTAEGLPNIHRFEQGGLVCASYVTYVYFNYLPNVAGIDTSSLAKPERSYDANCWYIAGQQWVNSGFSRYIDFTANDGGSINRDITFNAAEDIPIGSLICLQDWYNRNGHCTHICIYAGYVNGYHWVTHVGNENGPEFCAIERMNRNPHPQWPLAVITTPSNIRFSAAVEVTVKDENGTPIPNVSVSVKRSSNGVVNELGKTNEQGKVTGENLSYGAYEIIQTVPEGYTCENSTQTVNFATENNSLNTAVFTNKKVVKKQETSVSSSSSNDNSSEEVSSDEN